MIVFQASTDASATYYERSAVEIARSQSTAIEGSIASLSKNTTIVGSVPIFMQEMFPAAVVHVDEYEEQVSLEFVSR